jgi:hypothetical protein
MCLAIAVVMKTYHADIDGDDFDMIAVCRLKRLFCDNQIVRWRISNSLFKCKFHLPVLYHGGWAPNCCLTGMSKHRFDHLFSVVRWFSNLLLQETQNC